MAVFRRRREVVPGVSIRTLGAAIHKDVRDVAEGLGDDLATGEIVRTYFDCPPYGDDDQSYFIVTNQRLIFLDANGMESRAWETFVGIRLRAGYVRVGFRQADGQVTGFTAFVGGGPHEPVAMYAAVASAWSDRTGSSWDKDRFLDAPEIPPIVTR